MKNTLATLAFFLFLQISFAQKEDNTWILGYNPRYTATSKTLGDTFGNVVMKFGKTGITFKEDDNLKMDFYGQNASISDKQGGFLFCVDGLSINNAKGEVLNNGDSLFTSFLPQTAMILPQPGFDEKYYYVLLAEADNLVDKTGFVYDLAIVKLYYNIVEWDKVKNTGKIIKRQALLLQDTLDSKIMACRHGNGRDWWIVITKYYTNNIYKFLLTPQGIKLHSKQTIGKKTYSGLGQSVFSPDGKWFANYSTVGANKINQVIDLYNFDRCTGLLSNHQQVFIDYWAKAGGIAISPNSRYLYIAAHEVLYQADLQKPFTLNNLEPIASWEGSFLPFATTFWMMQLAPDNKIYINISNGVKTLHVIEDPNKAVTDCKFEQNAITLPVRNITMPNFPYFRLYDWQGSPCDTLGINGATSSTNIGQNDMLNIKVFPNPANSDISIKLPVLEYKKGIFRLYDTQGNLAATYPLLQNHDEYRFDISNLANGMYFWHLVLDDKVRQTGKVVVMKE